jgi:hypothetical protein
VISTQHSAKKIAADFPLRTQIKEVAEPRINAKYANQLLIFLFVLIREIRGA